MPPPFLPPVPCKSTTRRPIHMAYDLNSEHAVGTLPTTGTQHLRNQKGYLSMSWMEARTHIHYTLTLLGALCGTEYPVPTRWRTMLRPYERVEARLQHEINTEGGTRLAPPPSSCFTCSSYLWTGLWRKPGWASMPPSRRRTLATPMASATSYAPEQQARPPYLRPRLCPSIPGARWPTRDV
jgi:hypothetical protein